MILEIRKTHPDDLTEIANAEALIFSDPWTRADILNILSSEGAMCYTAKKDGKVIAYIVGRTVIPEGEIYRIATLPEYRGRGVAYRLLDFAVKTERGSGLESLFLEVRKNNLPARALYASYGFTEIGIRKNYYKNPTDDAIVMLFASKSDIQG